MSDTFTSRKDQLNLDEPLTFDSKEAALDWAAGELVTDKTRTRLIDKKADRDAQVLLEVENWEEPCYESVDVMPVTRPNWLIQDYIEHGTVGFLSGIYGSAKSFLALDWGCCVATAASWFEHRTREGNVIYVAAEGSQGIGRRYAAWRTENRSVQRDAMDIILSPVQLGYGVAVDWLCKRIIDFEADFLIIDTLARSIDGLNENDSVDMAKVITALYKLRDARGPNMTTVLVVHHTGWGDQTRSRGSSRLPSDTDFSYTTSRGDNTKPFTLKCNKLKEDRLPDTLNFTLGVVDVADDITSCVIRQATGPSVGTPDGPSPAAQETASQQTVLIMVKSQGGLSNTDLVELTGLDKSTVSRALGELKTQGKIRCDKDTVDGRTWRWYTDGRERSELAKQATRSRRRQAG